MMKRVIAIISCGLVLFNNIPHACSYPHHLARRSLFKFWEEKRLNPRDLLFMEVRLVVLHKSIIDKGESNPETFKRLDEKVLKIQIPNFWKRFIFKMKYPLDYNIMSFSDGEKIIPGLWGMCIKGHSIYGRRKDKNRRQIVLFYNPDKLPFGLLERFGVVTEEDREFARRGYWITAIDISQIKTGIGRRRFLQSSGMVALGVILLPGCVFDTSGLAPGPTVRENVKAEVDYGIKTTVTDSSWKCSTAEQSGWDAKGFNDSTWSSATVHYSNGSGPWGGVFGISSSAKWIWSKNAYDDDTVYFRITITEDQPVAIIDITADNEYALYHNGKEIGSGSNWLTVQTYALGLKAGDVVAVKAVDKGWIGGLIGQIRYGSEAITFLAKDSEFSIPEGKRYLSTDPEFIRDSNAGYAYQSSKWSWRLKGEDSQKILNNGIDYLYNGRQHIVKLNILGGQGEFGQIEFLPEIDTTVDHKKLYRVRISSEDIKRLADKLGFKVDYISGIEFENLDQGKEFVLNGFEKYFSIPTLENPVSGLSKIGSKYSGDTSLGVSQTVISDTDKIGIDAFLLPGDNNQYAGIEIEPKDDLKTNKDLLAELRFNVVGNSPFIVQLTDDSSNVLSIPILSPDPYNWRGVKIDLLSVVQANNPKFNLKSIQKLRIRIPANLLPVGSSQNYYNIKLTIQGLFEKTGTRGGYAHDPDLTPEEAAFLESQIGNAEKISLPSIDGYRVFSITSWPGIITSDGLNFQVGNRKFSAFYIGGTIYILDRGVILDKIHIDTRQIERALDKHNEIILYHEVHEMKTGDHKYAVLTEFEENINGLNYADIVSILLGVLINNKIEEIDRSFHKLFIAELLIQGMPLSEDTYSKILQETLGESILSTEYKNIINYFKGSVITCLGEKKIYTKGVTAEIKEEEIQDESGYAEFREVIHAQSPKGTVLIDLSRFIVTNNTLSNAAAIDTEYFRRFVYFAMRLSPSINLVGVTSESQNDIAIKQLVNLIQQYLPRFQIHENIDFANYQSSIQTIGLDTEYTVSILSEETAKMIMNSEKLKIIAPFQSGYNRVATIWQEFRVALEGIDIEKPAFMELIIEIATQLLEELVKNKQITGEEAKELIEEIRGKGIGYIPVYYDPIKYYYSIEQMKTLLIQA